MASGDNQTHLSNDQSKRMNQRKKELGNPGNKGQGLITPAVKKDMGDTLLEKGFNAVDDIIQLLAFHEEQMQLRLPTLKMQDIDSYVRTRSSITRHLMEYQYAKMAIEKRMEKVNVNVDYNSLVEKLNHKLPSSSEIRQFNNVLDQIVRENEVVAEQ